MINEIKQKDTLIAKFRKSQRQSGTASIKVNEIRPEDFSYKYGHFLNKAMDYIKKLVNIDIGIKILQSDAKLLEIEDFKKTFKPRNHFSNKGTYGYIGIIGGSKNYIGAVKLSSLAVAALRSGCGVSRLIIPESIKQYILPNILEATIYPLEDKDGFIIYNKENIDE